MIINLYDLKQYLWEVLEEFDHKNLNLDTPYFTDLIPTTENLALTLWKVLEQHPHMPALERIRLYEDPGLFADVTTELLHGSDSSPESPRAHITRRYDFSSASQDPSGHSTGHNYSTEVTISGRIDPDTGQVVNIASLDQIVQKGVIDRFHQKNVSLDPAFKNTFVSEGNLACFIWGTIVGEISTGRLTQVTVSEGQDSQAIYRGS
jgi:6-pyruvoyltetrahydropterin/6-carboxytetrahydropterin synthase